MPVLYCKDTQEILAENLIFARTFFSRAVGLLGKRDMPLHEALWIEPCGSIHTFFMLFPIDVLFLNRDYKIMKKISHLPPWRVELQFQSSIVVEWKGGALDGKNIAPGMEVDLRE